jgi:CO/xanthine dehydrogenase Mo-binding subunit
MEPQSEAITAVLAMKTKRPVKWVWTREEELTASTSSGSWITTYTDGVKKDGRIIARKIRAIRDSGAFVVINHYAVDKHCTMATGPYFIPNVWIDGYCVLTNKQPAGPMRGYGTSSACYAHEVQMDIIAEAIGKDPWEVRFINAFREGDVTAIQKKIDSVAVIETMKAAAEAAGIKLPEVLMAATSEKREERYEKEGAGNLKYLASYRL